MIKNGQMMSYSVKKYKQSLANTPAPIPFEQLPKVKMDLVGLSKYALSKGVSVSELSEEEKDKFLCLKD
jgi:hypothetical protein